LSIKLNGSAFPSYYISGETLAAHRNVLTFRMTGAPSRIGPMYVTGTDGEILAATTGNRSFLRFRTDPVGAASRVRVYAARKPVSVLVNGTALPARAWSYRPAEHLVELSGIPAGTVLLRFSRPGR
jgi:hypothetical protein